jgi:cytochrome P450
MPAAAQNQTTAPGPRGSLLLGMARELRRDYLGTLEGAVAAYGDVVQIVAGPPGLRVRFHLVTHPDGVQRVLAGGSDNYAKDNPFYREMAAVLGDGLLTSNGQRWRQQRRTLAPLFAHHHIAEYVPAMADEAARLRRRWTAADAPRRVDLHAEMVEYTLRVVGRALFGASVDDAVPVIKETFPVVSEQVRRRGLAAVNLPRSWPTPAQRRATAAQRALHAAVDAIVDRRRRTPDGGGDLVSLLLAARDPETGAPLSAREVRDQALVFLLAGHETTATALTFTLHLLGHHPDIQQRIRDEVQQVLGGRVPTAADAARLAYTTRVIKEAMRLYPPAYSIARRTSTAERIGGYQLPAGSVVIISPWAIHRHPRHWAQPEVFDPDRFTPDREAARHRYAYLPFAAGPRACIGGHFAMLEAVIATAMIVRAHHLRTPPGPVPLATGITLRPAAAVPCTIEPATTPRQVARREA